MGVDSLLGLRTSFGALSQNDSQACVSLLMDEIWLRILQFLPKPDLLKMRLISWKFNNLASDNALWKVFCQSLSILPSSIQAKESVNYFTQHLNWHTRNRFFKSNIQQDIFMISSDLKNVLECKTSNGLVCTVCSEGILKIYDKNLEEPLHVLKVPSQPGKEQMLQSPPSGILQCFAASDLYLSVINEDNVLNIWHKETGEHKLEVKLFNQNEDILILAMQWMGQSLYLLSNSDDGILFIFHLTDQKIEQEERHIFTLMEKWDEQHLVLATQDGDVTFLDIEKSEFVAILNLEQPIFALCPNAQTQQLAVITLEGSACAFTIFSFDAGLNTQDSDYFMLSSAIETDEKEKSLFPVTTFTAIEWKYGYFWIQASGGTMIKLTPFSNKQSFLMLEDKVDQIRFTWLDRKLLTFESTKGVYALDFHATKKEILQNMIEHYRQTNDKTLFLHRAFHFFNDDQNLILFCIDLLKGTFDPCKSFAENWTHRAFEEKLNAILFYFEHYDQVVTQEGRTQLSQQYSLETPAKIRRTA